MSGSPSPRKVFAKTAMLAHETAASEMVSVVVSAVVVDMLLDGMVMGRLGTLVRRLIRHPPCRLHLGEGDFTRIRES